MTQIEPHDSECRGCKVELEEWHIFEGIQFRRLEHWLTHDMVNDSQELGPYCWTCWKRICDIVRKGPR
jgi:hypothetical protein